MANLKLKPVDCSRGAPMGRREYSTTEPAQPWKFRLARVALDSGGYDSGGAYWGIGKPLYLAEGDALWLEAEERDADGPPAFFIRANDREAARAEVLRRYPNARFYR